MLSAALILQSEEKWGQTRLGVYGAEGILLHPYLGVGLGRGSHRSCEGRVERERELARERGQ